jgi:glycosyltransferase involved in cell wall biosynthesis
MAPDTLIILTAHNEADRIGATLRALASAFPDAPVWVADDGSSDQTAAIASGLGATVVRSKDSIGKGGAATLAVRDALARFVADGAFVAGTRDVAFVNDASDDALVGDEHARLTLAPAANALAGIVAVFCDGDLGDSASLLVSLADGVRKEHGDLAVAVFRRRVGGGLGLVVAFARWAIRRSCGLDLQAPLSGQRALRVSALGDVLPFARGFGMELGMTIDAARAGHRVVEVELDLHHRATGRTLSGFVHRAEQLLDCLRAYLARR